jgi:hypothetical protein
MADPSPPTGPSDQTAADMIATLRVRLHEAIQSGKASDAKAYLDLIGRLQAEEAEALSPIEALRRQRAESAQFLQELKDRINSFVKPKRPKA